MTQYILQSLNIKTNAVTKKALAASGKGSVKAQFGTQYLVVDAETGRAPKKQVLRKKGKDLIIEVDGVQVGIIRGFYEDSANKDAPTYRVDDFCSLDDAKSLEDSNKEGNYELVVGGTGEGSAHASGDGIVWHEDAAKCIIPPTDPIEAATAASEGLSQSQLIGLGLGALLIGGGATAIGVSGGSGGGGGSSSNSAPAPQDTTPPSAPDASIPEAANRVNSTEAANGVQLLVKLPADAVVGDVVKSVVNGPNGATITLTHTLTSADIAAGNVVLTVPYDTIHTGTNPNAGFLDGLWTTATTITDVAGNVSPVDNDTFTLAANAPVININPIAVDNIINAAEASGDVPINGTTSAEPGQTVTVRLNGQPFTTIVQPDGTWSVNVPGAAFAALNGTTPTISAAVTAANGMPAQDTQDVRVDTTAPVITITSIAGESVGNSGNGIFGINDRGPLTDNTVDFLPIIRGTTDAEAGQPVTVTLNGQTYTGAVQNDGTWSVQISNDDALALNHGSTYGIVATVSDRAGNSAFDNNNGLVVNIAPPDIPTVIEQYTTDHTPVISGLAQKVNPNNTPAYIPLENGDVLTVKVNGTLYTLVVGQTSSPAGLNYTAATGTWSLIPVDNIPNGDYEVAVTVTAGGITERDISAGELHINDVPPVINLDPISGGVVNIAESTQALPLTGTTDAAIGSVVNLVIAGQPYTAIVLPPSVNGGLNTFSVSLPGNVVAAIADGTQTATASVTNVYGATATDTQSVLFDTVAPAQPVADVAAASDTGISDTDNITADNTPEIVGTGVPGDIITVVINETGEVLNTVVAADGTWSVTPLVALPEGPQNVTVTATDPAGNVSPSTLVPVTIDTTAPTVSVLLPEGPVVDMLEAANGTPVVTTLPNDARVGDVLTTIVTRPDGTTFNLTTVLQASDLPVSQGGSLSNGSGPFTISQLIPSNELTAANNGAWATSTTLTDTAGNVSAPVPKAFTLDTLPSNAPLADVAASSDTGVSNTDNITSDNTPTIIGTGNPGDTITVTFPTGEVKTTTVAPDGTWNVTPTQALVDGLNNVLVKATDPSGNVSPTTTVPVTIDTGTALTAALNAGSNTGSTTDNITSDNTPTISGTGTPGDTITLKAPDGTVLGTTLVAGDGTWAITPTTPLADGLQNLSAVATDPAGNTATAAVPVIIDTTAPVISITSIAGDAIGAGAGNGEFSAADLAALNGSPLTIGGTTDAEVGQVVSVTLNGHTYSATVVAGSAGQPNTWQVQVPTADAQALNNGNSYPITATVSDKAGNTATDNNNGLSVNTAPAGTPTVTEQYTTSTTPTVSGTAQLASGDTLTVEVNGATYTIDPALATQPAGITYDSASGAYSVNTAVAQPTGGTLQPLVSGVSYDVVATTNLANGAGTVVDTSAGELHIVSAPTITLNPVSGGTINAAESTQPLPVTGTTTAPVGSEVTVTIGGQNYTAIVQAGLNGAPNSFSVIVPGPVVDALAEGTQTVAAAVTTPYGSATASTPVLVDTVAPNVTPAAFTAALSPYSDTGVPGDSITNDTTPVITGTGTPNDTINLYDPAGNLLGTAVVGLNGTWSIPVTTPLPQGQQTLQVTATDPAGNVSPPCAVPLTISVDSVGPAAPAADVAAISDSGVSSTDNITNDTTPTITGSGANPGDTITVTMPGTNEVLTTTVQPNGTWSVTPTQPLANGIDLPVLVTATDPAGNVSPTTTVPVTIDTIAPAAPGADVAAASDTGVSNTDNLTNDNTPTIAGTGTPGNTITVTFPTGEVLTTTVLPNGTWSVTPLQTLSDGPQTVSVTATDLAGNVSPVTQVPVTIDTSIPPLTAALDPSSNTASKTDSITADSTPTITGTGAPGDTVTVTFPPTSQFPNGEVVTVPVLADGTWSATPSAALPDGVQSATVVATDPAGNQSPVSNVPLTIDTTAPLAPAAILDPLSDTGVAGDSITADKTPTISGTGTPGDTMTVTFPTGEKITVPVDANGNWSATPTQDLPNGPQTVSVVATDPAGNVSPASNVPLTISNNFVAAPLADVAPASDTGPSNTDNITADNTPTITGNGAAPGNTITLYAPDGTTPLGTAIVAPDGTWAITPTMPLANGPQDLTAVATDPAGNVSAPTTIPVTIDTVAPLALTADVAAASDTGPSNTDNVTSDTTPTITGSGAAPGDTISLFAPDGSLLGTTTVAPDGSWAITPTAPLADGVQNLTVQATDKAGNVGPSTLVPVTIDTTAPAVNVDLTTDTSGTLAGVTVGNGTDNITNDTTPSFSGTGEIGAVITLTLANGVYKTTVDSTGHWTIDTGNVTSGAFVSGNAHTYATFTSGSALDLQLPNNGTNVDNSKLFTVNVTETDLAGNTASTSMDVTIDTIVTDPTIDATNGIGPITGTGEAGASVVLYQSTLLASTASGIIVDLAAGTWTAIVPVLVGDEYTTSKPRDFIVGSYDSATGVLSGTISAAGITLLQNGGAFSLYDSAQLGSVTTVAADGTWSVPITSVLNDGAVLTASSVDLAGNIDPPGVAIVSTELSRPFINPTNGDVITGTGKPGDTITLTNPDTGAVIGTAVVDANGVWSIDPVNNLPNGTPLLATASFDNDPGPGVIMENRPQTASGIVDATPPAVLTADVAASSDTGISNTDNITKDTTPTISGTGTPGDTITVTFPPSVGYPAGQVLTTKVDSNGSWSVTPPGALDAGAQNVSVTATDKAGNTTPTPVVVSVTIDTTAPTLSAVLDPLSNTGSLTDNITADTTPTISGSGEPGATITLTAPNGTVIGTAIVDQNGAWAITPISPLPEGAQNLGVTATDPAGNTTSASLPIVIDSIAPTAPTTATPEGPLVNQAEAANDTPVVTTLPASAKVGDVITTVVTRPDGTTFTLPAYTVQATDLPQSQGGSLSNGPGPFTISQLIPAAELTPSNSGSWTTSTTLTDVAGNISPAATSGFTLDSAPPIAPVPDVAASSDTGTSNTDNVTADNTPTITGVGTPGDTITVTMPVTGEVLTATVAANGTWSVTPTQPVADGVNQTVNVTASDPAGNTTTATMPLTIDTAAPSAPVITQVIDDVTGGVANASLTDGASTNDATPTIKGTAEANSTVNVYDGSLLLGTVTTDANGNWTLPLVTPLNQGAHSFTATATDAAGNTSPSSSNTGSTTSGYDVVVDSVAPSAPTATLPEGPLVNATEATDGTPVDTLLPSDAKVGDVVTTVVNGPNGTTLTLTSQPLTSADLAAGTVSQIIPSTVLTMANNGPWTTSTTLTDAAGNVSPAATNSFTLDTVAPSAPVITQVIDDVTGGVANASLTDGASTNDATPTIKGTAEANSTVNVYDGSLLLGTVTTDANGNWSLPLVTPLTQGAHSFTATATDPAGNVSPSSSNTTGGTTTGFDVLIDTIAPAAPVVTPLSTSDATPTLTGTAVLVAGDKLTVTVNGATYTIDPSNLANGTTYDSATGAWSVDTGVAATTSGTLGSFSAGGYPVTATITDAAGNSTAEITPASTNELTMVIAAPTINNVAWATAPTTSELSGVSEGTYGIDSTTHVTSGTVDSGLYVSEAYANGTVVRVQLPTGSSVVTPAANDTLVITWGTQSYSVPTALSAANISAGYVDVTVPYSVIQTQPFGTVNVIAKIQSATAGSTSADSPVAAVPWLYDVAAAQIVNDPLYGFAINGEVAGDLAGYAVANAGDVNGDGYDDILIGAPVNDTAGTNAGRAYVVFGGTGSYSNFDLSQLTVAGNTKGFVINGALVNADYGFSVAGAGDINGDGLADVIVGNSTAYTSSATARPLEVVSTVSTGPSYVIFGRTSTAGVNLTSLNSGTSTEGFAVSAAFGLGWSVTDAGDVNGDGLNDLAVTAPAQNTNAGAAYIVYGKTSGTVVNPTAMSASDGFVINGGTVGGSAAKLASVSSADVNGDGLSDLIVGAFDTDSGKGSVYVVYGNSNEMVGRSMDLSSLTSGTSTNGFRILGESNTGVTVAGAADINGDGLDDVLLQSTTGTLSSANPGEVWVAFGKKTGTTVNTTAIEAGSGGFAINLGLSTGNYGGYAIASAGDINGDGLGDIIVTNASYGTPGLAGAGSAYVVYGKTGTGTVNVANMAVSEGFRILGYCANDNFGVSASGAGDINGDGFDDIIVGAKNGDPGISPNQRIDAGMTYVIYGGNVAAKQGVFQAANGDLLGTTGSDTLTGTAGNNQIVGGDGNDILTGNGGADVLYGGRGDDRILINEDNIQYLADVGSSQSILQIDGGNGIDTLVVDGIGKSLALAAKAAVLQSPDPAIINVGLPPIPNGVWVVTSPAAMTPIRGATWQTTNPSGMTEIGEWSAYDDGINAFYNNTQPLADFSSHAGRSLLQLVANAGDDNIFVNISKRAGEKIAVSFDGSPFFKTNDSVDIYWGGQLLKTVVNSNGDTVLAPAVPTSNLAFAGNVSTPWGAITHVSIDLPVSTIDDVTQLKFVANVIAPNGSTSSYMMGDLKVQSNLVEIPPLTLTEGGGLTLKDLPVNVTLSDGVNSVYLGRNQLKDASGANLYWTDSSHTATTTTVTAGNEVYASANKLGQTLYKDASGNEVTSATVVTVQKSDNNGGLYWTDSTHTATTNSATTVVNNVATGTNDSNGLPLYWTDSTHTSTTTSDTTTVNNAAVMVPKVVAGHVVYSATIGGVVTEVTPEDFSSTVNVSDWNTRNLYLLANTVADTPALISGSNSIIYSVTQKAADGTLVTMDTAYTVGSSSVPQLPDPGVPLDRIHNVERIDLNNHANSVSLALKDVLNMSNDNVFNTTNGWTAVAGKEPVGWGALNKGNQLVIDGGSAVYSVPVTNNGITTNENRSDSATIEGQWKKTGQVQHTENGVTNVYNVVQSLVSNAQILVDTDVKLTLKPSIDVNFGELAGALAEGESISGGGTTIRVYIANTGADLGNKIQLSFGNTQTFSNGLTSQNLTDGYVDILVPTSAIQANVPNGDYGYVSMVANLVTSGNKLIAKGEPVDQLLDFISLTAPIIDATAWATTNVTSDTTGIPEAKYAVNTTTMVTSGTTDNALYASEVANNGTLVRVQLPVATGSAHPPTVGDQLEVKFGTAYTALITLTATDITTNKYVDVTIPYTSANTNANGVVASGGLDQLLFGPQDVTAQLISQTSGNRSDMARVTVNYNLDLAGVAASVGGFVINGNVAGENSGVSVASAGDVNGDGLEDMIIGAWLADPSGITDAGRAYVVFGKSGTTAIDLSAVAAGTGGFVINGGAGTWDQWNYAGWSVSSAGDLNGDGFADLLVSADAYDVSSQYSNDGRAYVVYGKSTTSAVELTAVGAGTGGFAINGQASNDRAGTWVSSAGDVNGDGIDDLIIGAPNSDPASGTDAGRSYVVFGKLNSNAVNLSAVSAGTGGFVINGQAADDYSGYAVSSAGDVNGDGLADVIVGAYSSNPAAGTEAGRSYVVFGKSSTSVIDLSAVAVGMGGFVINGQAASDRSGVDVASAGDVNGDGLTDLFIGADYADPAGRTNAGSGYLVFGQTGTTAINLSAVAAGSGGFVIKGAAAYDYAGRKLASAGDFNGDGLVDMIVGAYGSDRTSGLDAGRSYLIYGRTGTGAIDLANLAVSEGFEINGQSGSDYAGRAVSSAGDINGDGFDDLIIGAYAADPGATARTDAGKSYVILGGSTVAAKTVVDFAGTASDDNLNGLGTTSNINEQFVGGLGNDTITGGGGADVMYGGAGNDTFVLNADNVAKLAQNTGNTSQNIARIDGGTGMDVIKLDGSGVTLDLSAIRTDVISGIEQFDITGSGNNTVKLSLTDVLDMGSSNLFNVNPTAVDTRKQLMVTGDAGDVVQLTDLSNWTLQSGANSTFTQNGHNYVVYNHNTANVQLLVDEAIYNANAHANVHA